MNIKKIVLFLLLAFGISWITALVLFLAGVEYGSALASICVALLYMGAPAIAAIIIQKFVYKQPIIELGLKFREAKGWRFLWIPVFYLLLCFLWMGIVALFGNSFQFYGFGTITFDPDEVLINLNAITNAVGGPVLTEMPLSPAILFTVQIISSFIAGAIVNTIFTMGEELGWRGFLFNETKKIGFWKSNLLIGIIWGLWHAPLILQGHNYPNHPVAGVLMMVLFCIPLGYIMSYLRVKTNSVLAPAIFHGTLNAIGGNLMLYTKGGNDLIGGIAGISGVFTCVLIVLLIVIFDRKTIGQINN